MRLLSGRYSLAVALTSSNGSLRVAVKVILVLTTGQDLAAYEFSDGPAIEPAGLRAFDQFRFPS